MKSHLKRISPQVFFALFLALTTAPAISAPPPNSITIDPTTGLPVESWKDEKWKDPDKILPQVVYDGLPIQEVIRDLSDRFTNAFDILAPSDWKDPNNPQRFAGAPIDPLNTIIKMKLRNVTASEVFNAMNLMFEAENSPLRWNLMMNGNRPTALLRILPELLPHPPPPDQPIRKVFFVGDLLGDEKSGGATIEQLLKTIQSVYQMSLGEPKGILQFHKEAQLLVITGTGEQIEFIQQTISALQQKARSLRIIPGLHLSGETLPQRDPQPKLPESKNNVKETKTP